MYETLLDRAKLNYKMAEKNFDFILEDDVYLNLVGYLLQQSLELALKHLLEINGIKYPKTHSIRDLIEMLPEGYSTSDIEVISDTVTSWESKTRYIKNFRLSKRQLEEGFEVIGKFLNAINVNKSNINDLLSQYLDESEIEDFLESVPRSTEITKDNVEFLTSMYKQIKRK